MFSPLPLIARVRRKLGSGELIASADERVELAPAITSDRPPAIALPGEFDRAIKFHQTRQMEHGRVAGGKGRSEGATIAYLFRDALIAGGALYKGSLADFYRPDGPRYLLSGSCEHRAAGLLATSLISETYFGDWLVESFSRALLAERIAVPAIGFARNPWLHQPGYEALLGMRAAPVTQARFDELWVIDDRGMNADRGMRLREIRRRLRAHGPYPDTPDKVFLARGALGQARDVVNSDELTTFLTRRGYTIVHPEQETPANIARLLSAARVTVAVEGSVQVHAVIGMPEGGTLVILQPPLRFTAPGKDMADLVGLHYAYLVGDLIGQNFAIDLDRFATLLDRVESGIT